MGSGGGWTGGVEGVMRGRGAGEACSEEEGGLSRIFALLMLSHETEEKRLLRSGFRRGCFTIAPDASVIESMTAQ